MVMPIKYTDEMVAEALAMRARGEKQLVIHATFGAGIEMAIRRVRRTAMAHNSGTRTREAFEQLTRYCGEPLCEQIVAMLESLARLNDDLYRDKAAYLIEADLNVLQQELDALKAAALRAPK